MRLTLMMLTLCCALLLSCTRSNINPVKGTGAVTFYGLLTKLEVTSFQYGTHMITNDGTRYALRSSTVNLDTYVNKKVTITGTKVPGYPVDFGPEYLDVTSVR